MAYLWARDAGIIQIRKSVVEPTAWPLMHIRKTVRRIIIIKVAVMHSAHSIICLSNIET